MGTEVVDVDMIAEEQDGVGRVAVEVDGIAMLGQLVSDGLVHDGEGCLGSGAGVEEVDAVREDRDEELARGEVADGGDFVLPRGGVVGKGLRQRVEPVDASSVSAYPDASGRLLPQADDDVVAQAGRMSERHVRVRLHCGFTHTDETVIDASHPDIVVVVAVDAVDGVGGEGVELVARCVLHVRKPVVLHVQDVDASSVRAHPDLALPLGDAEDNVMTQV